MRACCEYSDNYVLLEDFNFWNTFNFSAFSDNRFDVYGTNYSTVTGAGCSGGNFNVEGRVGANVK